MRNLSNFEATRGRLHHNRLKNEFLFTMGYHATDAGSPKRGIVMRKALHGDDETWVRLKRGCDLWNTLSDDIRCFFATLTSRYGFVLTDCTKRIIGEPNKPWRWSMES